MSNVTITKSSPADYVDNPRNDTRRTTLDAATDYRPVAPAPRDWQSIAAHYAGAAVLIVIVMLLYLLIRFSTCTAPWLFWSEYSDTCETFITLENKLPWLFIGSTIAFMTVRGVTWCFQAGNKIEQGRIENERFSLLPDRFGNPTPADLYAGLSPAERFDKYYLLVQMATDLSRDRAPYEYLPGSLNTYSPSNITHAGALPEPIEEGLTLIPDDQWRKWLLKAPHLLIGGKTDAGKTTFETMLLGEYIVNGDQVLILDPHWQPGKWYGLPATSGIDAILSLLPDLLTELTNRLDEYKAGKLTEEFDRLVILIDEVPAIVSECIELTASGRPKLLDQRWPKFARNLGSEARKVGVRVILGSQSTDVQDLLINRQMKDNYTRIGLGNQARPLLSQEIQPKRKQALHDLLRGQSHPAAMEYRGDYYVLDTSNVVALAERHMRPLARMYDSTASARPEPSQELLGALLREQAIAQSVSGPSALHTSVKAPGNSNAQQTDSRQTEWDQAKKVSILRAMRRQGITRNDARERFKCCGQGFDNDHWVKAGL